MPAPKRILLVIGSCLLIAAAVVRQTVDALRKCPFCAELVQPDAKICRHCNRDIAPESVGHSQLPIEANPRIPVRVGVTTGVLVVGLPSLLWFVSLIF